MTATDTQKSATQTTQPSRRWRGDVEGLRAAAVGLVLAYHAGLGPSGGFLGVDVFFVVSGFVITTQIVHEVERSGRLSLVGFYARRAKRLLPAAGLVLLTAAVLTWFLAPKTQRGTFGLDISAAAGYVVNWTMAARSVDYLAEDVEPSPVQHFWSLAVEEQFYIVWPLAILLVLYLRRRIGRGRLRASLAVGLSALIIVPTFVWSVHLTAVDPSRAFFVTTTRLWEMGIGAFVALGAARWARLPALPAAVMGWLGMVGLGASAWHFSSHTPWPGYQATVPTLATAAVIVAGFSRPRAGPEVVLGTAPMRWVGGLSYSLYLWHWPVLRAGEWIFGPLSVLQGVVAVLFSALPAWLSYKLVENPLRRNPWLGEHPRRALRVGAVISVTGVVVGLAMWGVQNVAASSRGAVTGAGWDSVIEPPVRETVGDSPFFDALTPTPEGAPKDAPALYEQGCQTPIDVSEPTPCPAGDPNGSVDVAVVGDSKAAQWVPAVDAIGKREGWRVTSWTKSACPLVDAVVGNGEGPYTECREWGQAVMRELTGPARPDVVITSTIRANALDGDGEKSRELWREGLRSTWQTLRDAGVTVIAISDTPQAPDDITPVYECVAEHLADPGPCSWPLKASPASKEMRSAARDVDAHFIDMDPWVCPGDECVGVYRNVLTYRQKSHITATFAEVLADPLEPRLMRFVR